MFVEYNGVSLIREIYQISPMNIMLIAPNGEMLDFKCIVVSKLQPTMDNSSIMMNWIFFHMFMIELGLLVVVCLLINNPNKVYIVVPFIKKATFAMYVIIQSFWCFFVFKKIILVSFYHLC
jgi:hypothetical protein